MMLQRLATGETGVKQARYRRRPTGGTRTRMREGYSSRRVCLSVCPSVPALAASASVETSKQRYSRVFLRLFLD